MEHKPEYADNDQTIFRKPKDRDHPYVVISKTVFEDAEISWKAKGMMGYLLSRPDDWTIILGDLVKRAPEGRGSVRTILRELEQHGYLLKRTLRDDHGRWAGTEMIVLEHPAPLEQRTYREKNTASKTPHTVEPHTDNCPLLSTDPVLCTDLTKEEPPLADSQDDSDADVYVSDWTPRTGSRDDMSTADADDISRDGILLPGEIPQDPADDSAETASMFKDPKPSPHEPVEQGKARRRNELGTDPLQVAAVVAQNRAAAAHPDGGDASKDGDPWMDRPVKEWCAFIGLKYERQSIGLKRMLGDDLRRIATTGVMRKTVKAPDETGEAIRKMTKSDSCKWLRSAGRPTHKEFTNVLINVLCGQVLEENGSASGGRNDPPQVDQAVAETMARLFDENGVRIRRE